MLRILSGQYRSRPLVSPPGGDVTRPYTARVRESVFGLLRGWFEDASVLDLFAGVGTMGLETVSRGARSVLLVEQDRRVYDLLLENVHRLDCGDRARTLKADALGSACLLRAEPPVSLVFVDPPYATMKDEARRRRVLGQIARCRDIMGDEGFIILRSPVGPDEADLGVPGFEGPEVHRYGREMYVLLYAPGGRDG